MHQLSRSLKYSFSTFPTLVLSLTRSLSTRNMPVPKTGDALPDIVLYEGTPLTEIKPDAPPITPVNLRDVFAGKKGVLVNVPGAFTPGCSKTHLPGFVDSFAKFQAAGAEVIVFTAVNDPFVLTEWGVVYNAIGKIRFLADTHGKLAEAFDCVLDTTANLGNKRGKRFSVVVKDNVITHFNLDDGLSCSLADPTLAQLASV
ncbi:hypothetical protein CEUSTIGMA_g6489.t1 [Chlamydomonas eustigma]|uniref:Glutaredoxin-dependent peroxiredoxin n=1 Tax=Chlamydomonas eustigma TaxID=1157962 RepID=A0A250X800_9CHLO|nr:hypothetical protein CEUSTIGMA_g6489.t1 [Chlamydomonas eustigma]|eukprot:GAX79049.1 hypothetical protein CEUSTIGMA_g6489.t1 [Chlamydomonas eustigma]